MPGMQLAYTKINNHTQQLEAFAVHDDTPFALNSFGVAEPVTDELIDPQEIDMIITPLLVCDESGYRVGYGKGFYDKYLAQCRPDVLKVGLSYFDIIPAIDDVDDFDVSLNICITPHKVYEF
jgi:5-formyltetrahydrofolate cyclo-ligase